MAYALFNGSFIGKINTGIGVLSKNLITQLSPNHITLLDPVNTRIKGSIPIPSNLSPQNGWKGHLRRLFWMQNIVPKIMKNEGAKILLSPLPEAPVFSNVRTVVIAHDLLPIRFPRPNPLFLYNLLYVPTVLYQSEIILCNSNATAKELHEVLKIPINKLVTITLGYNNNLFYSQDRKRENFFLILGRHNPHKNLARVLKSFAIFKNSDYKLVFAGPFDSRYTPRLQRISQELGISHLCEWKDWVSDEEKLELLNRCRCLIIASLWEGFGLPAIEALACGSPVIASNRGALPEVLGGNSLMVDPLNTESIADAMREISLYNKYLNDAYINGPIYASKYKWSTTAREVEDVLQSIA